MPCAAMKLLAALLLCGLIQGCAAGTAIARDAAAAPMAAPASPVDPSTLPPVAISQIETGRKTVLQSALFSSGSWFETTEIVFSAIVVRHPDGNLLIDTGLGTRAESQFATNALPWRLLLSYDQTGSVKERLAQAASPVRGIDTILLTHLHWDHAGGLPDFPQAEVLTTRAEYEYASAASPPQVVRAQFQATSTRWRFIEFRQQPYENFPTSFDLFADGSVVVVPLPGHTPGSLGAFVNLRSGARYFFPGDVTWAVDALRIPAERPWLIRRIVDSDEAATRESIRKVHDLMKRRPELIVLPAHDPSIRSRIPAYPGFIR